MVEGDTNECWVAQKFRCAPDWREECHRHLWTICWKGNMIPPKTSRRVERANIAQERGGDTVSKKMQIPKRMLSDVGIIITGRVRNCDNEMQLIMKIQTELPNGQVEFLNVLVDTGAEANLVKIGKMPRHLVYAPRKPLNFVTASGQRLRGGDTCIDLTLESMQKVNGNDVPDLLRKRSMFYEADIRVDVQE